MRRPTRCSGTRSPSDRRALEQRARPRSEPVARHVVVVDQEQRVAGVPSFAKKLVGDSTRAITTQVWTGDTASYVVETPGKPTSLSRHRHDRGERRPAAR